MLLLTSLYANAQQEWRALATEDVIYQKLETRNVIIEIAPFIAPKHDIQFKKARAEVCSTSIRQIMRLISPKIVTGFSSQLTCVSNPHYVPRDRLVPYQKTHDVAHL